MVTECKETKGADSISGYTDVGIFKLVVTEDTLQHLSEYNRIIDRAEKSFIKFLDKCAKSDHKIKFMNICQR